jgi:hypothetical protein
MKSIDLSQDIQSLNEKEEKEGLLDSSVESLAMESNTILKASQERIAKLPDNFKISLKDNIVQYFLTSADRYDKDTESGLDKIEFQEYAQAMLANLTQIIEQYVPPAEITETSKTPKETEAQIAERKKKTSEMAANAGKMIEDAGNMKVEKASFSQTTFDTPQDIGKGLSEFNENSGELRTEISQLTETTTAFQYSCNEFEQEKKSWSGIGKGLLSWFKNDPETEKMKSQLVILKKTLTSKKEALQKKKESIGDYGEIINGAGNVLKTGKQAEKNQKIIDIEKQESVGENAEFKNKEQYEKLEAQQKGLGEQRDLLLQHRYDLYLQAESFGDAQADIQIKKEQLQEGSEKITNAVAHLETAIDLLPQNSVKRKELEAQRDLLKQNNQDIDSGQKQIDGAQTQTNEADTRIQEGISETEKGALNMEEYLLTLDTSLNSLNSSIQTLEVAKLENGTQRNRIDVQYAAQLGNLDIIDEEVSNSVLNNNLANEQMFGTFDSQINYLNELKIEGPNNPISSLFEGVGKGLGVVGHTFAKGFEKIGNAIKNVTKDIPVLNVIGEVVAFFPDVVSGVWEGAGELCEGLATMIAHPIETSKGLGALIGRNPQTGEWSFSTVGNTWKELGKVLLAWDDFAEGDIGKGVGKVFLNVLLTATGAGAGIKGAQAAGMTFRIARAAGGKFIKSAAKATFNGAKVFGTEFGSSVVRGVKGLPKSLVKAGKGIGEFTINTPKMLSKLPRNIIGAPGRIGKFLVKTGKEFPNKLKKLSNRKANKLAKLHKKQLGLKQGIYEGAEGYAKYEKALAEVMQKDSNLPKAKAVEKLFNNPQTRELVMKGLQYEKNQLKLAGIESQITGKMYSPGIVKYTDEFSDISLYGDALGGKGDLTKMFTKKDIDLMGLGRGKGLEKLKEVMKTDPKALAKIEKWIELEKTHAGNFKEISQMFKANKINVNKLGIEKGLEKLKEVMKTDPKALAKVEKWIELEKTHAMNLKEVYPMFKKYDIDASSLGRSPALEELSKLTQRDPAALVQVEKWMKIEKQYGTQLDDFNDLTKIIKKRRGEHYNWGDDVQFNEWVKKNHNVDDITKSSADEFLKLKEEFLQTNIDDLFVKSKLDISKEIQRMNETLYGEANGIKKMNTKGMNYENATKTIQQHIDQFAKGPNASITQDAKLLIQNQLDDLVNVAKRAGVKESDLTIVLQDAVDKLLYQTVETIKRQLGDHGIRHISGNIRANRQIMETYESAGVPFTATDELEMMLTHIGHDMGYTSVIDLKGFTGTGAHPHISMNLLENGPVNVKNAYKRILGEDGYSRMKQSILNHDGTEVLKVNPATMTSTELRTAAFENGIKYSDNLALYSADKLPQIYYTNSECAKILSQIDKAVQAGKGNAFFIPLKNQMRAQVIKMQASGEISSNIANSLLSAVDEINTGMSAKSTLGMFSGQHADEVFSLVNDGKGNLIPTVKMESSLAFESMSKAAIKRELSSVDAGTKAFMKIMEDYADKNKCTVRIGTKEIYKPGPGADFGDAYLDIRKAIKANEEIVFIKDGVTMMKFDVGTKGGIIQAWKLYEARFSKATTTSERLNIIQEAKINTTAEMQRIEEILKNPSLDNTLRAKNLQEHVALQTQIRQIKDLEIATDILKNANEIKSLHSLESMAEALRMGDVKKFKTTFAEIDQSSLSMIQKQTLNKVMNNLTITGIEQSENILRVMVNKGYESVFTKYQLTPAQRVAMRTYLAPTNIGVQIPIL